MGNRNPEICALFFLFRRLWTPPRLVLEQPPLPEVPEPEPELKQYPDPELDDEPYVQTYVEKGFIEYRTLNEQIKFITEHGLEAW